MAFAVAVSLVLGFMIPVHVSMNSRAGILAGSPPAANVVFWILGLCTALAFGARDLARGGLSGLRAVPLPLWSAGALGALISLSISMIIPKIGVGNATFLMLLGQMIASTALSAAGVLGSPREAVGPQKIIGLAVMAAGAALYVFARPPVGP